MFDSLALHKNQKNNTPCTLLFCHYIAPTPTNTIYHLVQINKAHAAALQEDANCFEYDAFYDTIQEERKEVELASFKREQQGPRYLAAMMSARDRRQRIQDMAYNRREALAAQAEDGLYEGKEKFATAAYRKKLEEDKLFAEQLAEQYAPLCSLLLRDLRSLVFHKIAAQAENTQQPVQRKRGLCRRCIRRSWRRIRSSAHSSTVLCMHARYLRRVSKSCLFV